VSRFKTTHGYDLRRDYKGQASVQKGSSLSVEALRHAKTSIRTYWSYAKSKDFETSIRELEKFSEKIEAW
jgi:hypothetical protein